MSKEEKPELKGTLDKEVESMESIEGFDIRELQVGQALEVETQNRTYLIERLPDGFYVSGNPKYCPVPTKAEIRGSIWSRDGSAIKQNFVGEGLLLEFSVPGHSRVITSQIKDVRIAKRTVQ